MTAPKLSSHQPRQGWWVLRGPGGGCCGPGGPGAACAIHGELESRKGTPCMRACGALLPPAVSLQRRVRVPRAVAGRSMASRHGGGRPGQTVPVYEIRAHPAPALPGRPRRWPHLVPGRTCTAHCRMHTACTVQGQAEGASWVLLGWSCGLLYESRRNMAAWLVCSKITAGLGSPCMVHAHVRCACG